ncbi:MAG: aminopeptidase N C-terminal domain-containing protein, partial [Pseudomonadota bacterium]
DSDPFNRWEAGQRLAMRCLLNLTHAVQNGQPLTLDLAFIDAQRKALNDASLDPAFRELALSLPSEAMIAEQLAIVDPQAIHTARQFVRKAMAQSIKGDLLTAYEANLTLGAYRPDAESAGKRGLKNLALSYLLEWSDESTVQLAKVQAEQAENMTDRVAALAALINSGSKGVKPIAAKALRQFYSEFKNEALVIDKWFSLQATANTTDVKAVRKLMLHPAFTLKNPNRARSLVLSFCNGNPAQFHAADGSAYAFWAEQVIALDAINPQVAARLARSLDRWRKYSPALQLKMQQALQRVAKAKKISKDVLEIVSKALAS